MPKRIKREASTVIVVCTFITASSALLDIDLEMKPLVKHCRETHTLLAGVIFGVILGVLFGGLYNWSSFPIGFVSEFTATINHLINDLFTYTPIMPLYPLTIWGLNPQL